jgi:hypothetical protein
VSLVAAATLCVVSVAHANGDPASDVLLSQDHFLPYAPEVQSSLQDALEGVLEDSRKAGYPMKVALVFSERDLGAYPQLFNSAQEYADLLTQNLSVLNPHEKQLKDPHVLVVMPGGFGGNNLGERVNDALEPISIQTDAGSDGLAKAAIEAVARVATVNGYAVPTPPEADIKLEPTSEPLDGGGTSPLVFGAPALAIFVVLLIAGRVSRRRDAAGEVS